MAITHDDLTARRRHRRNRDMMSSNLAHYLVALSLLCGAVAFVLCLAAEAHKSEVSLLILSTQGGGSDDRRTDMCAYSGSGSTALRCAAAAFLLLAFAMFLEHAYTLVAVTSPQPPDLTSWTATAMAREEDLRRPPQTSRALAWQACLLFLATWASLAIAEAVLLVGIDAESSHLDDWRQPREICFVVRQGLFATAGVFGLLATILGAGLYLTALRAQRLNLEAAQRWPAEAATHPPLHHHHTAVPPPGFHPHAGTAYAESQHQQLQNQHQHPPMPRPSF